MRHPDTIPGLEPDCRRVLRDAYMRIMVARRRVADTGATEYKRRLAELTEDYRELAREWGVSP